MASPAKSDTVVSTSTETVEAQSTTETPARPGADCTSPSKMSKSFQGGSFDFEGCQSKNLDFNLGDYKKQSQTFQTNRSGNTVEIHKPSFL